MKRWLWSTLGLLLVGACWKPMRVAPPVKILGPSTFSHQTHFQLEEKLFCDACHEASPQKMYALARPGSDEHKPCTQCHAEDFKKPPGPLCGVCHESVNPRQKGESPLTMYPAPHRETQLIRPFNHKRHLEKDRGQEALRCPSCHVIESQESPYMAFPGHEACASCHGRESDPIRPLMKDCRSCHSESSLSAGRNFLQNDIRFTHAKHQKTREGRQIECLICHHGIKESEATSQLPLPEMKDCATCHEDAARTPDEVRISKCQVCHLDHVDAVARPGSHTAEVKPTFQWASDQLLASLAPSFVLPLAQSLAIQENRRETRVEARVALEPEEFEEHPLPSTRRPDDHTAMFRVRHEGAASSDNAKCKYCHVGVSGSPVSSCQDCHVVMRPRSHTARFRGVRHGRLAAIDPKTCATCHEVDYCTGCHNIAPPSHFPLSRFRMQHSRRASANPRACLTCHTTEATCFRCHQPGIQ